MNIVIQLNVYIELLYCSLYPYVQMQSNLNYM